LTGLLKILDRLPCDAYRFRPVTRSGSFLGISFHRFSGNFLSLLWNSADRNQDRERSGEVGSEQRDLGESVMDVVIVGGGLAGMSAAESMARCFGGRVKITVLEAKRVTGGRAGSFADPLRDEKVDYCQHVAMGCCTNFVQLLQRCRLDDVLCRHEALTFVHPVAPPSRFAPSSIFPAPFHLAGVIRAMTFMDRRQQRQVHRGMARLLRTTESELRGRTAGSWLRQQGQDDDTIGEFWGTFVVSALGEEIDRVDMSAVRKVMVDGFASARGASDVLVPTIPLAELFGHLLPERIAELGVEICTGHTVNHIEHRDGKATLHTSLGGAIRADHVVSTVPWHCVGKLFPDDAAFSFLRDFDKIPSSAITGIHLWLDREITDLPLVVLVGTVAQWLFRPPWRDEQSQDGDHYYQVVISASNKWKAVSKESLVKVVMRDLQRVSSEAQQARLLHHRVVTDPNSVFSIRPDVMDLRPPSSTPLPWLHLAGDWIDTGWPATMEGAVISGRMAANSVGQRQGWEAIEIDSGLPRGLIARAMIRSS
jgi:squalene-associated FAD-dependent desaturase